MAVSNGKWAQAQVQMCAFTAKLKKLGLGLKTNAGAIHQNIGFDGAEICNQTMVFHLAHKSTIARHSAALKMYC